MELDKIIEFVKILKNKNCHDPLSDIGFLMMVREHQLKKKPNMKKFNMIFYGDTMDELRKNIYILINEIDCFYDIREAEKNRKVYKKNKKSKVKKRK